MPSLTNRLNIYLIKDDFSTHDSILREIDSLESKQIEGVGTFYYSENPAINPSWVKSFFGVSLDGVVLTSKSVKAIFLVSVAIDEAVRIFAITFGSGWTSLKPGVYEERFGLKTALNIIDPIHLRKITKKNLSSTPKDTSEQLSKAGAAADFGIDVEQDLVRAITGQCLDSDKFGKSVTGGDPVSFSVKVEYSGIKTFLEECYRRFTSDDYKSDFGWIDQISEVRDTRQQSILNDKLIESIVTDAVGTWMAVPDIIEWEKISGFRYSPSSDLVDDIDTDTFKASLSAEELDELSLKTLKEKEIWCIAASNGEPLFKWSAFNCLYSECEHSGKTYLFSNGRWYEIAREFASEINDEFIAFRDAPSSVELPDDDTENEGAYNKMISDINQNFCLMDKKLISHGGSHSTIEFCDLFGRGKEMIHVKHYGGSSVLSHLFSQGLVSGELFLRDEKFRVKVNAKLSNTHKLHDTRVKPIAGEYKVIFGVISKKDGPLQIPFFSKVSLRNARKRLETFGYQVSVVKINKIV